MNKIARILATSALAALAIAANAQVTGRSFDYKSTDAISQDFSAARSVDLKARTVVYVLPYLYISGNLGAEWTVDGWGTGIDSKTETIKFFHNETLTLDLEYFGNPTKTEGTKTGDQEVALEAGLTFFNDQTGDALFESGFVAAEKLNDIFNPAGPSFQVAKTGGLLRVDLGRKISIKPEVGPGRYENVGVISVNRN
jgi:hypothetical protein